MEQHFGAYEAPKPDFSNFVAYFNVDDGTGRIRGASIFGPPEAAAILRAALAPFEDLGVMGASAMRSRLPGSTDSTSFNAAGLAGINLAQDPIEYNAVTWHTNLDTYERVIPEDMKQMATVVAAAVWHLANRDQALPRFSKQEMPPPVWRRRGEPGTQGRGAGAASPNPQPPAPSFDPCFPNSSSALALALPRRRSLGRCRPTWSPRR